MASAERITDEEWRLDETPAELPAPQPQIEPAPANLSHVRLTRPVYVVTAEHIAWYLIAAYAVLTRAIAPGARPFDPAQATNALTSFLIAQHGPMAYALSDASWVTIVQGWIFGAAGASDANARIVVTVCGLVLVAIGFLMRPALGRAGGFAFAGLIAISPSIAYVTRGGSTAIASVTFMMVAVAIAENMRARPTVVRGAGLGAAIALWLSADPIGYVTAAATLLSLVVVGVVDAIRLDHRRLRLQVWWERRRSVVLVSALVTIVLWVVLTTGFFHRPLVQEVLYFVQSAFARPQVALHDGIRRIAPILVAYEFLIVVLALAGLFAIASGHVGDRFAAWSVVWALATLATFGAIGMNRPDAAIAILMPMVVLAAYAVDWMHHLERWDRFRYAISAGVALTLYVQVVTNFVYSAPDTSEASWRRHALLFWSEAATSIQTPRECARIRAAVTAPDASAMIPDDAPQVQWYLRDLMPTDLPDSANVVVTIGKTQPGAEAGNPDGGEFGFEEWWQPNFHALTVAGAVSYFFTQRVWSDVQIKDLKIEQKPVKAAPK